MSMDLSTALKHLFSDTSSKPHRVHNALLWLRSSFVKRPGGVARLRQRGGLSALLRVVAAEGGAGGEGGGGEGGKGEGGVEGGGGGGEKGERGGGGGRESCDGEGGGGGGGGAGETADSIGREGEGREGGGREGGGREGGGKEGGVDLEGTPEGGSAEEGKASVDGEGGAGSDGGDSKAGVGQDDSKREGRGGERGGSGERRTKRNTKHLDMALSILANCAMEEESRKSILKQNGVKTLGDLLPNVEESSVKNRICRLLGNLSQDPKACQVIHDNGVLDAPTKNVDEDGNEKVEEEDNEGTNIIEQLIGLLEESTDPECQQTYLRTIRLLCNTPTHQERVIADGAMKAVCLCLKSTDKHVLTATLKTLAHLTKSVDKEATLWQVKNGDGPSSLVTLATTNPDPAIAKSACSMLLHFAKLELLRPTLAGAEALTLFLEKAGDDTLEARQKIPYLNALCVCCKDVVNRVRIREGGGLELFLGFLDDPDYRMLFNRIISSLVCFLYDDAGMEILRTNGLVSSMLKQLRRVARLDVVSETEKKETEKKEEDVVSEIEKKEEDKVVFMIGVEEDEEDEDVTRSETSKRETNEGLGSIKEEKSHGLESKTECSNDTLDITEVMDTEDTEEVNEDNKDLAEANLSKENTRMAEWPEKEAPTLQKTDTKEEPYYSIDSPTYKAMSEFKFDCDLDNGPRNIMEAQQLTMDATFSPRSSPVSMMSGRSSPRGDCYSPLSVSSYLSSDCSPDASPRSMTMSPPIFSDPDLADSSQSGSNDRPSPSKILFPTSPIKVQSSPIGETSAGINTNSTIPNTSLGSPKSPIVAASVVRLLSENSNPGVTLRSPASFGALWWCPEESRGQDDEIFSDEEDAPIITPKDAPKIPKDGVEISSEDVLTSDPLYVESMVTTDFGRVLQGNPIGVATPKLLSPSVSTDSIRDLPRRNSRGKSSGLKRKLSQTSDDRSRIERRLSSSSLASTSGLDINDLMEKLKEAKSPKAKGKLDGIDIDKYRDPRKATEHNILVILAKLSFSDDPSEDIVRKDVIETLLDYAIKADEPFPRGSRILLRMTTNPSCFHKALYVRFPCLVTEKLGEIADLKSSEEEEPKRKRAKREGSSIDRQQRLSSLYQQLLMNLAMTAESRYGLSLLERILQASKAKARMDCVFCVPYFTCSEAIRNRIFGKTDTIHYLCQSLLDPRECKTAMSSILYLVRNLPKPPLTESLLGDDVRVRGDVKIGGRNIIESSGEDVNMRDESNGRDKTGGRGRKSPLDTESLTEKVESSEAMDTKEQDDKMDKKKTTKTLANSNGGKWKPQGPSEDLDIEKNYQSISEPTIPKHDLVFVLDDGSRLPACRETMVARSQVFAAMLDGHFAEAGQSDVRLAEVNALAMRLLIRYLEEGEENEEARQFKMEGGARETRAQREEKAEQFSTKGDREERELKIKGDGRETRASREEKAEQFSAKEGDREEREFKMEGDGRETRALREEKAEQFSAKEGDREERELKMKGDGRETRVLREEKAEQFSTKKEDREAKFKIQKDEEASQCKTEKDGEVRQNKTKRKRDEDAGEFKTQSESNTGQFSAQSSLEKQDKDNDSKDNDNNDNDDSDDNHTQTILHVLQLSHRYLIRDAYATALHILDRSLLSSLANLDRILGFAHRYQLRDLASACVRCVLWSDGLGQGQKLEALRGMREERMEAFVDILEDVLTKANEKVTS